MPNSKDPMQSEPPTPKQVDPDPRKESGERGTLRLPERRRDQKLPQRSAHEPDREHTITHAKSSE